MFKAAEQLDAPNVEKIFLECLYKRNEATKEEILAEAVAAEGINHSLICFHSGRLNDHKNTIEKFIKQLPKKFEEGWSFLNMCATRSGDQWGEHRHAEQLLTLGIALGLMEYTIPKTFWDALPGGMPYVRVKENAS